MRFAFVLVSCATIVSACAPREKQVISVAFDAAQHKAYAGQGSGKLVGQAFLRQQGGGVVTCAGSPVMMAPDTPYFQEMIKVSKAGKAPIAGSEMESAKATIKSTVCDAQGNFVFDKLPPGRWFVGTDVRWTVGYNTQGGSVFKAVTVAPASETKILLTDADLVNW